MSSNSVFEHVSELFRDDFYYASRYVNITAMVILNGELDSSLSLHITRDIILTRIPDQGFGCYFVTDNMSNRKRFGDFSSI